jgi:Primase C terminal 1 (PriCT-1)/Bifunctional DNA primase/polymerase, N-terminal
MVAANTFGQWQPEYSKHGIATFPTRDKVPIVANYHKMGRPASAQFARKYPDEAEFGFCCGKRSKVTIIDYDSTDEALLREGNRMFGESPLLVRTRKGLHAYYRHDGERRRIRPFDGLDLDILGENGLTVAAPSAGREFIRGNLDTLEDLPVANTPAELLAPSPVSARVPQGQRDNWLFKKLLRHAPHVDDFDPLLDVACTLNMECDPTMSDAEVVKIATSAWRYQVEGRNWVGRKAKASTDRDEILALSHDPAAGMLLLLLRVSHPIPDDRFAIDQVKTAALLKWDRERLRGRIHTLISAGRLERVHYGKGKGDPHVYQLTDRGGKTTTI